ncbi:hypothetical protein [Streptomyces sp. NBC_00019]|uniref:hypothetical protein n=1 Tax=Streptomyces sp. NBC_00019 TaxID=2975623 RepID=UPI003246190E
MCPRRRRVPDLELPEWQQIIEREYEPWNRDHVVVDTAGQEPKESLALVLEAVTGHG